MFNVVWFKRDARVQDHAPLAAAVATGLPVVPLHVVEPSAWALPTASGRQWAAQREALADLSSALAARGAPLVVRVGSVVDVLEDMMQRHGPFKLWAHAETFTAESYARDNAVRRWARARGIEFTELPQFGIRRPHTSRDGWAAAWEVHMHAPVVVAPEQIRPLPGVVPGALTSWPSPALAADPCPGRQRGGRAAALNLLNSFVGGRGRRYPFQLSSPLTAARACSRLSVHIAHGSVSLREVVHAVRAAQHQNPCPLIHRALGAFTSRLYWHCHFMQKLEDEPALEFRPPNPLLTDAALGRTLDNPEAAARFNAWATGRTGWPLVDAVMRELTATGWCTFRMRAMLVSVATYQLWLPTRAVGEHLAKLFTDYEPGIHWPQIYMQAGATGANVPRCYNPIKQHTDHDPDGVFTRRWVPELRGLPACWLPTPWAAPAHLRPTHYPAPLVDEAAARKLAQSRLHAATRGEAGRSIRHAILAKHGSRAGGLASHRASPPPRQRGGPPAGQLALPF